MENETTSKSIVESLPKGSYWREAYENAPALAKEYYEVNFALTPLILADNADQKTVEELEDKLEAIYEKLDDESWRYILDKTSGPSKLGLGKIWKSIRAEQAAAASSPSETAAATTTAEQPATPQT